MVPRQIPGMARLLELTPELWDHYTDAPAPEETTMTQPTGMTLDQAHKVLADLHDPAETYAERMTRVGAEADALRKRGSKLARKLLHLYIGRMNAQGPKATAVAGARFAGACEALSALHGWTESAWQMAVIESWQQHDGSRRPAFTPTSPEGNLAYLRWEAGIAETIDAHVKKLMY
jgi:hypothetical protein